MFVKFAVIFLLCCFATSVLSFPLPEQQNEIEYLEILLDDDLPLGLDDDLNDDLDDDFDGGSNGTSTSVIVALGGTNQNTVEGFNSSQYFLPDSNVTLKWSLFPSMSEERGWYPAAGVTSDNNMLVVAGGYSQKSSKYLASAECLDTTKFKWRDLPNMEEARGYTAGVFLSDGFTFMVCGGVGSNHEALDSCECLDVDKGKWHMAPALYHGERAAHAMVRYQGEPVILGGWNGQKFIANCERFNEKAQKWVSFPHLNVARAQFGAAVVLGDIYVAGGFHKNGAGLESVEVFNGKGWAFLDKSMSVAHVGCGAVSWRDHSLLVVLGGSQRLIEVYDPKENTWTTLPPMNVPVRDKLAVAVFKMTEDLDGNQHYSFDM